MRVLAQLYTCLSCRFALCGFAWTLLGSPSAGFLQDLAVEKPQAHPQKRKGGEGGGHSLLSRVA